MQVNFGDLFLYFATGAAVIFMLVLGFFTIREDIDERRHRH